MVCFCRHLSFIPQIIKLGNKKGGTFPLGKSDFPCHVCVKVYTKIMKQYLDLLSHVLENGERKGDYLMRERRSGSFHRSLRLPDTLDKDKVKSRYDSGVLSITFPKVEAKKGKQVKVEVGS